MKTFAWISLVAVAVAAQNDGIPGGLTDGCNTFLKGFNSDSNMQSCLKPLMTATARFLPSANMQSNEGDITWALDQLSAAKGSCQSSNIRTTHTNMWNACQNDLTSGNQASLVTTFELLYMMKPLIDSAIAKDTDGKYCLPKAKKNGGHMKRADGQSTMQIDANEWKKSNLMYLFANPDASADQLCTSCTKQVLTSWVTWENQYPYPMGISSSNLLSTQKPLWTAINNKCPADFSQGILNTANAAPANVDNAQLAGSTGSRTVISTTGLIGALMALGAALA